MNMPVRHSKRVIYILEVNPRASRTVPFVSKATGIPLAKVAARVMEGKTLAMQQRTVERIPPYFFRQERYFPFIKFPEADPILGARDEIHGEVMGTGNTFGEAYAKRKAASGVILADPRLMLISVCGTATNPRPRYSRRC